MQGRLESKLIQLGNLSLIFQDLANIGFVVQLHVPNIKCATINAQIHVCTQGTSITNAHSNVKVHAIINSVSTLSETSQTNNKEKGML